MAEKRGHKMLSAIEKMKPVGCGSFGPIFDQFVGRPEDAIALLMKLKTGEVIGALYHISVGNIDLVWGVEGTEHSDGYGLAKLAKYHPEVEKKNSVPDNTMNTDETPKGKRNDTATPQNTVSKGKGSEISETSKGEG